MPLQQSNYTPTQLQREFIIREQDENTSNTSKIGPSIGIEATTEITTNVNNSYEKLT